MKVLRFLYGRFYQLMVDVGNGDMAIFASILLMTLTLFVNFVTIIGILDFFGVRVAIDLSKITVLASMACLSGILYFLLVHNGKSARILSQFEGETKKNRLMGRIIAIGYFLLSVIFVVGSFLLMMVKNRG